MLENDERLINALKPCDSEDLIEDTFKKFEINDYSQRIKYLNNCMGNPRTFFTEMPEEEQIYMLTIQMFLTGSWKLNEYYDRLNLPIRKS